MTQIEYAHGTVEIGARKDPPVSGPRASKLLRQGRIEGARKEWCTTHGLNEWKAPLPITVLPPYPSRSL